MHQKATWAAPCSRLQAAACRRSCCCPGATCGGLPPALRSLVGSWRRVGELYLVLAPLGRPFSAFARMPTVSSLHPHPHPRGLPSLSEKIVVRTGRSHAAIISPSMFRTTGIRVC